MHSACRDDSTSRKFLILLTLLTGFANLLGQAPPLLVLGDSLGQGVQSGDANALTQPWAYAKIIAFLHGVPLPLPLIKSGPFGTVGNTKERHRLDPTVEAANISVSGATVGSALRQRADALTEDQIDSETDLVMFPRLGSQVEVAESLAPPVIICWLGSNNALRAALSFDQLDASQMTPVAQFRSEFEELALRLGALGGIVIFGNIPDVTRIGFLLDRQDLLRFLGDDFGLVDGEFTSLVAMFLIKLGLDGNFLLSNPNWVLDSSEVSLIQSRIDAFNQIIDDSAAAIGMPVVDIHGFLEDAAATPPVFGGVPLTTRYLGGLFSLDGVHPSNIGHALISNAFIQRVNSFFGISLPVLDLAILEEIFLGDPFVDKDGDGKVLGRFGAGALETVAPLLGLSGDLDEITAPSAGSLNAVQNEVFNDEGATKSGKWNRGSLIRLFKDILRPFTIPGNPYKK